VTRRAFRWFRFAVLALLWLGAAALQVYVSDIGTHGVMVGAYLPAWLLSFASIPPWALLFGTAFDGTIALLALRLRDGPLRMLLWLNVVALVLYGFVGVAVIFYIAFTNNV
jgi:hypothetical protein